MFKNIDNSLNSLD